MRSKHETKFFILNGNETVCLNDLYDIRIRRVGPGEPSIINNYVQFNSAHGRRFVNSQLDLFPFFLSFHLRENSFYNLTLVLVELRQLFLKGNPYYIVYSREPGKRFKVRPASFASEPQSDLHEIVEVVFDVFEGCSESIGTTLNAVDLESDEWQFSQGIVMEDIRYVHETNNFEIWNLGSLAVDPREHHELLIRIEGMSEGNVTVFNRTTGERFIYHSQLNSVRGEALTIDGVYPRKNGVHCGIDTNGELISLVPGRNEIQISNISRLKISFEFRFRYE